MTPLPQRAEAYFAANRASWDERVGLHLRDTTGIYPLDAFRAGADLLGPIEASEIGNVAGKRILHLQCHFGIDTISLSRRGADVTGLDFSPQAVATARSFADELSAPVRFIEGNVYDAAELAGSGYDMVFTTWGTVGWLPDVQRWAQIVADCLAPGGTFYFADGHPTLIQLEEKDGRLEVRWDRQTPVDQPIVWTEGQSYAGDGTPLANRQVYCWDHPISEVVGSLLDAGLSLQFLHEHDMIPWQAFPSMRREGRMFIQAEGQVRIPLAYSLRAVKS